MATVINLARDFSRFPAARYRDHGPYSGEMFRDDFLLPALETGQVVTVELDGVLGYPSSFLEEAFGGLIRRTGVGEQDVRKQLVLVSKDETLISEIWGYISAAVNLGAEHGP